MIIVDKSKSMLQPDGDGSKTRWDSARSAVEIIAQEACKFDRDGITLYFFSASDDPSRPPFTKHCNVTDGASVMLAFSSETPKFGTDMTSVLEDVFLPLVQVDAKGKAVPMPKPMTVLFITDGAPAEPKSTKRVICFATKRIVQDDDLSISFVQIGNDKNATAFLQELDEGLVSRGAKFDVVDTLTDDAMGVMSFDELVQKSVND